jgi:peptidoglycan hydrolase-like protein with peptidoglycan-binding domain
MLSSRASLALVLFTATAASPALASSTGTTSSKSSHKHHSSKHSHKVHGQQAIEPARVTEIQQALIREHYLSGEADGAWDAETIAAMQKFQADQGWQTKLMPDSRALKKLGLGPDYSTAINAKNATFSDPPPVTSIPESQAAGFAAAAGTNN